MKIAMATLVIALGVVIHVIIHVASDRIQQLRRDNVPGEYRRSRWLTISSSVIRI